LRTLVSIVKICYIINININININSDNVEIVTEQTKLMCQNEIVEYRYQPTKAEMLKVAED